MAPLLWVVKTADSKSLSHSEKKERLQIFSQAQRTSRRQKAVSKLTLARQRVDAEAKHHSGCQCCGLSSCSPLCYNRDVLPRERLLPMLSLVLERDHAWTRAERRSAAYFQEVSVYKIISLQRDLDFWKGVVPRLAELHLGIRHLVVAIAATFELLFVPNSYSLNKFALKQCNKALHCILSAHDMDTLWLATSCILVSAYNLLRSDLEAADKSIESGLRMITQATNSNVHLEQLSRILTSLGKQHGFKLWAPDITFQFDKTLPGREILIIDTPVLDSPFISVAQVLSAFKTAIVEHVAKLMRNLSLGAHIDPNCPLAQDVSQNFSDIFRHWRRFYDDLSDESVEEKLQLVQLKVGLLSAYLLFVAKVTESNEVGIDVYEDECAEIVRLGQEVIAARHAGRPVIYLDRIVNGALYTTAMICRDPIIRRELIRLLKSQVVYVDGLVNYLRGRVAEVLAELEERDIHVNSCYDIPEDKRVRAAGLYCREDRLLCVRYMMTEQTDRLQLKQHFSQIDAELAQYSVQEIDDCLKGMTSAYTMYMKVDIHVAPDGYLRKMYYREKLVKISWRADLAGTQKS